jgi:UDP-N-acetylmuramoyl-L-alanyl-D-glutamate--2,6-diaminopimelate ligase
VGELLAQLDGAVLRSTPLSEAQARALAIAGVRQDSRAVEPGELFVALVGAQRDGRRFIPAAVERGAVAVLTTDASGVDARVPCIEVADPRAAMARAAALVYGRPTERLSTVGITGTNGKTTTAHLLGACLRGAGARPGVVGTLGSRFEDLALPSSLTSPEADELQRVARAMLDRGASHLVMEVSSIALQAQRVAEVRFAVAAFSNLTQDHLDFHGSMEAYAEAKAALFLDHAPQAAVINVDDPFGAELARRFEAAGGGELWSYSCSGIDSARVRLLESPQRHPGGLRLQVAGLDAEPLDVALPLVGEHNAANALCALSVVAALGLPVVAAAKALAAVEQIPGRLERCSDPAGDDIAALVDYAHTPDALERSLASVRPLTGGKVWCVFGCGGDRDVAKREPMGAAVAQGADVAIVTNDNPRSEEPLAIAEAIVRGVAQGDAEQMVVELDRARAIELAVKRAAPGDVVLVAGKGHETYQIIGDRVLDFDDRDVVRAALERRRARRGQEEG